MCGETVVLRREDAAYTRPEVLVDVAAQSELAARSLKTILRILRDLSLKSEVVDLQRSLLEAIFDLVPAQRGAILVQAAVRMTSVRPFTGLNTKETASLFASLAP